MLKKLFMAKTTQMQIRLEPELKEESERILAQLGLKPTEYIRMALRQLVYQKGLPFEVRVPNAETVEAIREPRSQRKHELSAAELLAGHDAQNG